MAEESTESPEKRSGAMRIALFALAIVAATAAGAGGAWLWLGGESAAAESEPKAEEDAPSAQEVAQDYKKRMYELDPFVVNVQGEGYPRFLKLKLAFEVDDPEVKKELDARIARVRDITLLLLSSRKLADVNDFEGKALLKDDLRERLNEILETGGVQSVLFTEFVIQ